MSAPKLDLNYEPIPTHTYELVLPDAEAFEIVSDPGPVALNFISTARLSCCFDI
jgi:hypothetical protein